MHRLLIRFARALLPARGDGKRVAWKNLRQQVQLQGNSRMASSRALSHGQSSQAGAGLGHWHAATVWALVSGAWAPGCDHV